MRVFRERFNWAKAQAYVASTKLSVDGSCVLAPTASGLRTQGHQLPLAPATHHFAAMTSCRDGLYPKLWAKINPPWRCTFWVFCHSNKKGNQDIHGRRSLEGNLGCADVISAHFFSWSRLCYPERNSFPVTDGNLSLSERGLPFQKLQTREKYQTVWFCVNRQPFPKIRME